MQSMQNKQVQETQELQQKIAQLEMVVKQCMTKEAISRISNVKIVDPEKYVQALAVIGQMMQAGQVQIIDDEKLKQLLQKLTPEKKDFKINK